MSTPLRIMALFIFFFQAGMAFMGTAVIYPGMTYNTTSQTVYSGADLTGGNVSTNFNSMFNPSNPDNLPSAALNLFGMGWVYNILVFGYNVVNNCTLGAPAFYTSLFALIDPTTAPLFGAIVGSMQAFAFGLGFASLVMRWNI